jgi:hypothetical protein
MPPAENDLSISQPRLWPRERRLANLHLAIHQGSPLTGLSGAPAIAFRRRSRRRLMRSHRACDLASLRPPCE